MTTTETTHIVSSKQSILASGLAECSCYQPLAAVYPNPEFESTYNLEMHLYIPDSIVPRLNQDIGNVIPESDKPGSLLLRIVEIDYDTPPPSVNTYSLWKLDIVYQVEGEEADAIMVKYVVGDPLTSRGTVTAVAKS